MAGSIVSLMGFTEEKELKKGPGRMVCKGKACGENDCCLRCAAAKYEVESLAEARKRAPELADILKDLFKKIEPIQKGGDNAEEVWTKMAKILTEQPAIRKELSHLGAVTMTAAELRATALTKKLKSIRVEAMMSDNAMIYRGTKDLGNAFYADWVIGNFQNIAAWHNEEKK